MAIVPCLTGLFVSAAAWAIGAEPRPDSLEKIPRDTPILRAIITVAPAKPPVAAVPLNALSTINNKACGISETCINNIINVDST
ncbi:MAG: Uncharacterised protein [Cellvibrionales bacterium UBA7375]|nr:MAG: Uncharacterised protein [Cellvibrionales bacterium UBA7375]